MMNKSHKKQKGMTLIELLLVIGIGSLIVIGGIVLFGNASDKNKSKDLISNFGVISQTISNLYASRSSYTGLTDSSLIDTDALPKQVIGPGPSIVHPWGTITVAPAGTGNPQYSLTYSAGIPASVCVSFVTSILNAVDSVDVGGTVINTPADASAQCGGVGGTAPAITITNR